MSENTSTSSIVAAFVAIVVLILILASLPATFIWALNTLFPLLTIELSWSTYFASWAILGLIRLLTTTVRK